MKIYLLVYDEDIREGALKTTSNDLLSILDNAPLSRPRIHHYFLKHGH